MLQLEPAHIAYFKAIVEAYDNLLTMRTEEPAHNHLKIWFDPLLEEDVRALLEALRGQVNFTFVDQ